MQETPEKKPKEKLTRAHKIALAFISLACCALIGGSCFALTNPDIFSSDPSSQTEQEANNETPASETPSDSNNEGGTENANSSAAAENSTQGTTQSSSTSSGNNTQNTSSTSNNQPSASSASNTTPSNNQPSTVSISVSVSSSAADGRVSGGAHPTFSQGATAYDALCATGLSVSASQTTYGIYVSAIGGLAEKEFGGSSGWMYSVNGSVPQTACSNYILKDGDVVSWYYVV